jgi:alpha-tubulin suppressor-like RCC1 family protein
MGKDWFGQLGDGTAEDRTSPVQVGREADWASVYAGVQRTMALKSDGTLWGWGANWSGRLGDGMTEDRLSPVQVGRDNG